MQGVHADREDTEDEQLASKDEPLAPALRKRGAGRHKASQGPDDMTEKRAFLNFVPRFGRGTIQQRRYINFHYSASRRRRFALPMVPCASGNRFPRAARPSTVSAHGRCPRSPAVTPGG